MGRDPKTWACGGRGSQAKRLPAHDGWGAHFCEHRRHGWRRMEYAGAGSEETRVGRRPDAPPETAFHEGRLITLRTGQMVSWRITPPVVVRLLLAQGWPAGLEARGTFGVGIQRLWA